MLITETKSHKIITAFRLKWWGAMRRKIVSGAISLLIIFLMLIIVFIVCEGLASLALLVYGFTFEFGQGLPSRTHVQYDKNLGWINIPNLHIPDMYGSGVFFRTNSRSYRGNREIKAAIAHGKVRIVCLGDSFTLGIGVNDDHSYPELLMQLDPRFETVNMGEAGYGVGQAYLRYRLEEQTLDHDALVFAFIYDDIRRMRNSKFLGYDKPFLALEKKVLITKGVPVPRARYILPWITHNRDKISALRSFQLMKKIFGNKAPRDKVARPLAKVSDDTDKEMELLMAILDEILKLCEAKGREVLFVYLEQELESNSNVALWEKRMLQEVRQRDLPFLDLAAEFRELPKHVHAKLFDPAWRHYTVAGYQLMAKRIHEKLLSMPRLAK